MKHDSSSNEKTSQNGITPLSIESTDYTYLWFRDRSTAQKPIVNVRTGKYGLSVDISKGSIRKLGVLKNVTAEDALIESNDEIEGLSDAAVSLVINNNNKEYRMTEIKDRDFNDKDILRNSRLIRSGVYMQSFDINNQQYGDFNGNARLEINAVADYFTMSYDLYSKENIDDISLTMNFMLPAEYKTADKIEIDGKTRAIHVKNKKGAGYTLVATNGDAGIPSISYDDQGTVTLTNKNVNIQRCASQRTRRDGIGILVIPGSTNVEDAMQFIYPLTMKEIKAKGIQPYDFVCIMKYQPRRAVYEIKLHSGNFGTYGQHYYILEQAWTEIKNNAPYSIKPMLMFTHTPCANSFGTVSMLREKDGTPSGIPVQLTKNWHTTEGKPLYLDSNWFEAYVPINIHANSSSTFEYTNAFEAWGKVYHASHTQLCLIGYVGPQWVWEQTAIGGFGENLCYSPDITIVSFIGDMRPLNVTSNSNGKYGWTNSVAGADFLVYVNNKNQKQFLKQMKTNYINYGPNLTHVKYAGITADNKIAAEYSVRMGRSDDVTRAYLTFDYKVLEDVEFNQLAFFQIGADTNNESGYDTMNVGSISKSYHDTPDMTIPVVKENTKTMKYLDKYLKLTPDAWISMSGGPENKVEGAWADRGVIIRDWKATFSGMDYPPYMSIFAKNAHHGGFPTNQIEFTVPLEIGEAGILKAGDRVSCTLELLVLPQYTDDYHGPNKMLSDILKISENARWKLVDYQAKAYDIRAKVSTGTLISSYPTVIKAENDSAEFTIENGAGYVPVEITNLSSNKTYVLEELVEDKWINIAGAQEVYGNDYWQCRLDTKTNTYTLTYNVWRDSVSHNSTKSAMFRLRRNENYIFH